MPPITKTIQVRRTRHAGQCWRSRDELISDELLWTPTYGRAKAGWPARTYIQQLCEDTECSPEDLPEAMNDREKWRERSGISVLVARHDDDNDDFSMFFSKSKSLIYQFCDGGFSVVLQGGPVGGICWWLLCRSYVLGMKFLWVLWRWLLKWRYCRMIVCLCCNLAILDFNEDA